MDPHRNIFFYYAGSSSSVKGRDRQIEDNTTKALVNLLELTSESDPERWLVRSFMDFVGVKTADATQPRFALQRSTIGEYTINRAKQKLLLGIAPRVKPNLELPENKEASSRPDAWIWFKDAIVCVETKVVGTFNPDQLAAHSETLGTGSQLRLLTWHEVYAFFADQLAAARSLKKASPTTMLLEQFVAYLRIIAYRQEIDMGEFDGFRPEHFAAFAFLDDEDAEDNRKQVKHYLGQFVDAVRSNLPGSLTQFKHRELGVLRSDIGHSWSTLSRGSKPVDEAHFSFAIRGDELSIKILLEGARPTRIAKRQIEENPDRFLELLQGLPEWLLLLKRRWQLQAQKYAADDVCLIRLDRVREMDIDYVIAKMNDLERKIEGQGYFELIITRLFQVDDPIIRSKEFASKAASMLEQLVPLERFLSGDD